MTTANSLPAYCMRQYVSWSAKEGRESNKSNHLVVNQRIHPSQPSSSSLSPDGARRLLYPRLLVPPIPPDASRCCTFCHFRRRGNHRCLRRHLQRHFSRVGVSFLIVQVDAPPWRTVHFAFFEWHPRLFHPRRHLPGGGRSRGSKVRGSKSSFRRCGGDDD